MKGRFDADTPLGKELKAWWEELHGKGKFDGNPRTGDRSELKRAKNLTDVILLPAFQKACPRFGPFFKDDQDWEASVDRLAAILCLAAYVKEESSDFSMAYQMAGKPKPALSELRFRRLIQRDRDQLFVAMIRVIRKLGNKANLHDLANSVYYWGDRVKRDWAFDYFPNTPEITSA